MSKWGNADNWAKLCSGEACVICRRGGPLDVAATLERSWLTAQEDAPLRGYCCLVFRRHAVELHDLSADEAGAFMRDIQQVSRAVQAVTGAIKMNYEIHGNSLPHLHMHFYPRSVGDAFEDGPIDWKLVRGPVYAPGEFAAYVAALQAALIGSSQRQPPTDVPNTI